ncbi:phage integrase central domain-containing protein [Serratia sp. L9]|uniref:phage integrase central domain-containing protein n=1 Tax=Serratia sp. L9 TaxID=3423946 RepID=UPI003D66D95A
MYLFPPLGKQTISDINTADLLYVIKAIEDKEFLVVAMRLQQHIASLMRYAIQNQMNKYYRVRSRWVMTYRLCCFFICISISYVFIHFYFNKNENIFTP